MTYSPSAVTIPDTSTLMYGGTITVNVMAAAIPPGAQIHATATVGEPGALVLFGLALVVLGVVGRRHGNKRTR